MKKICVVTGSRAEYGIMRPLLIKLNNEPSVELDAVVTAMHLEEKYGFTYKQIEEDNLNIIRKIPLNLTDTSKKTVVNSLAILTKELGELFDNIKYDLIIILGDRYEMLPVVNTALIYNVPVCHLHGGEITLGNFDESIRHAITKMSHLHLSASEQFRKRIIQLGERPERVFNIGAIGVENVLKQEFLTKKKLEKVLNIKLENEYYVVLFHPVTLEDGSALSQIKTLLSALKEENKQVIFIGSNSDTDSDKIMKEIENYVENKSNSKLYLSLTTQQYHSLVKCSNGLIGNSSSGLIEIPSLKVPTLNIGNRQLGRLRGPSVVDVDINKEKIKKGLDKIKTITDFSNPYEQPNSSELAKNIILEFLNSEVTIVKEFKDL